MQQAHSQCQCRSRPVFGTALTTGRAQRCRKLAVAPAAQSGNGTGKSNQATSSADDDAELERLESLAKGGRPRRVSAGSSSAQPRAPQQREDAPSGEVRWKEGQFLPDGWENLSAWEKAVQLYMGERGLLFWANKAAYASVFVIGGGWVLFRFVGPALGLYDLSGGPPQQ